MAGVYLMNEGSAAIENLCFIFVPSGNSAVTVILWSFVTNRFM